MVEDLTHFNVSKGESVVSQSSLFKDWNYEVWIPKSTHFGFLEIDVIYYFQKLKLSMNQVVGWHEYTWSKYRGRVSITSIFGFIGHSSKVWGYSPRYRDVLHSYLGVYCFRIEGFGVEDRVTETLEKSAIQVE